MAERSFSQTDHLGSKLSAALLCGLGTLGLFGLGGCSDPLRSTDAEVIKSLAPEDRYIHDYVGDESIGDDCMRGTDYALVANVDGAVKPVARLGQTVDKAGNVIGYTVTPRANPNKTTVGVETQTLNFKRETTGNRPMQPADDATAAVLARLGCSTEY